MDLDQRPAAEPVDCVVPAAGRSERMGSWKPLLPFAGSSIVECVAQCALESCSRVILVAGYRAAELESAFHDRPRVVVIENPDWRLGMFSSIRRGVERVATRRFFVTLGDMPWIRPEVYRALLAARELDVVFPTFDGVRGHPVLFTGAVKEAILRADPAAGAMREIAAGFRAAEMPWSDASILRDIDTPKDLEP
jgi:molybdenum cofactor cytidylyltransferase